MWVGIRLARSVKPMMVTPFSVTTFSPGTVRSQFPPPEAARSTITLPGFMFATISAVMVVGACPRTSAVVTRMSALADSSAYTRAVCAAWSWVSSRAYPSLETSCCPPCAETKVAPIDWICSATSGRTSKARTLAPRLPAAPIAANPATPAPITKTVAGWVFPAAVTWPANIPP